MPEPKDDHDDDPFLTELLDKVLADHADLPPEVLDEIRWVLELAARSHPTASAVVNRARPRKAPLRSGEQQKPGAAPLVDDAGKKGTGG